MNFPWKSVWRSKAPRRVCFFVWSAAWNKILTYDNLMGRGYTLTNWCCMCRCEGESVDHLLIHFHVANVLWHYVFSSFGILCVLPRSVFDLLDGWWNLLGKHTSEIWNMVPLCLMWTLWKERNSRIFEDKERSARQLLDCFSISLFHWSRAWGFTSTSSIIDFISSLLLISHDSALVNS
jgi:hypothetical protein